MERSRVAGHESRVRSGLDKKVTSDGSDSAGTVEPNGELLASFSPEDLRFMSRAMELAHEAEKTGEVPVGAVIVKDGAIIAEGWNRPISTHDPSAHAEMIAMRSAAQVLQNYRLLDTTLYVTLEPCAMCAGAMVHARVKRLIYAATDPRAGAAGSVFNITQHAALNHRVAVEQGLLRDECSALLRGFFLSRR